MAIVDDFPAIRALMKGELKAQPKEPSLLCPKCNGFGKVQGAPAWHGIIPVMEPCPDCNPDLSFPKGVSPNMPPPPTPPLKHHLLCFDCNGMGRDYMGKPCSRCNGLGIEP